MPWNIELEYRGTRETSRHVCSPIVAWSQEQGKAPNRTWGASQKNGTSSKRACPLPAPKDHFRSSQSQRNRGSPFSQSWQSLCNPTILTQCVLPGCSQVYRVCIQIAIYPASWQITAIKWQSSLEQNLCNSHAIQESTHIWRTNVPWNIEQGDWWHIHRCPRLTGRPMKEDNNYAGWQSHLTQEWTLSASFHDQNNDRAKGNQSLPTQPRNPVGLGQWQRHAKKLQAY